MVAGKFSIAVSFKSSIGPCVSMFTAYDLATGVLHYCELSERHVQLSVLSLVAWIVLYAKLISWF